MDCVVFKDSPMEKTLQVDDCDNLQTLGSVFGVFGWILVAQFILFLIYLPFDPSILTESGWRTHKTSYFFWVYVMFAFVVSLVFLVVSFMLMNEGYKDGFVVSTFVTVAALWTVFWAGYCALYMPEGGRRARRFKSIPV